MKQKLISVLFLVLGLIALVGGFVNGANRRKIEVEGVHGAVTIKDKIERKGMGKRNSDNYFFVLPSMTRSTPPTEHQVPREMYDSKRVGDIVAIQYLESAPDDYIILGKKDDSRNVKLAGLILTVLGALGTWWFVFKSA
jgi:hypothetical protein